MASPDYKKVNYRMNQPCVNDGFQVQGNRVKLDRNPGFDAEIGEPPDFRFYKLGLGVLIVSLQELVIGGNFTAVVTVGYRKKTNWVEQEFRATNTAV